MLEDGYCSPTTWRHATTELGNPVRHPPSQEWAALHVAPSPLLSPRGPGERRAWGEAMHNMPMAAVLCWHPAAGIGLLHASSCSCPTLQGCHLPWGFRRPREFLGGTMVFVKCPLERSPVPEPLCPSTSSTTHFQAAPGAAGTVPGRPLLQRVRTACTSWGLRLLGAGQPSFPSLHVGPALEPRGPCSGAAPRWHIAFTTPCTHHHQEGTSVPTPEPSAPTQQLTSINSSKPPHQVCAGAEGPACATHHLPLQKGWFQLGGGGSGSGNCTPSQQLPGWELAWHPRKCSRYTVGMSGPEHPRLPYVG